MGDPWGETGMGRYRKITRLRTSHQMVAWDFDRRPFARAGDLIWYFAGGWIDFHFDPKVHDLGPHKSFCRGELPDAVYADYLEEQGVPLPPTLFDILRGWDDD